MHRRLRILESRSRASLALQRIPEEKVSRERQFEDLFRELGFEWPPVPRNPEQAFEELLTEFEPCREENARKETV